MQTFLPWPDFARSAEALDGRRLGKQRVETLQVMKAITDPLYGWRHHPVALMWRGYRPALMAYQRATCAEWRHRGFADTCLDKTRAVLDEIPADAQAYDRGEYPLPPWFGDPALHASHRSNLVRKDPEIYAPIFPGTPDSLPYVWPVKKAG